MTSFDVAQIVLIGLLSSMVYLAVGFGVLLLIGNSDRVDRVTRYWGAVPVLLAWLLWPAAVIWLAWQARRASV